MVGIDLEPPTPRDPFYRRPARNLSLVRRVDPVRIRCEARLVSHSPDEGGRMRVLVSDDGKGIPAGESGMIFQKYLKYETCEIGTIGENTPLRG